jgi:hypothetical protein
MMEPDTDIYIVDEIIPKPGRGEALLKHYMDTYAPRARNWGMKLNHSWVCPPVWLEGDQQNTLLIIWSVESVGAFWDVQVKIRWDRSVSEWWSQVDGMITSRTRRVFGGADHIGISADV